MRAGPLTCAGMLAALCALGQGARADLLPVVNGSFESPATTFVAQAATGWTLGGPPESAVSGVFSNNSTAPGDPAHFTNAVGDQLAFIGTQSGNEMTQTIPGAYFESGSRYTLSAGIAVSNTLMPPPTDAVRIALFYLDTSQNRQIVASTDIVNSPENALSTNLVKYFTAATPVLREDDPALGMPINIELTTIGASGRYFDLENVTVDQQAYAVASESLVIDYPQAGGPVVQTPEPRWIIVAGLGVLFLRGAQRESRPLAKSVMNYHRARGYPRSSGQRSAKVMSMPRRAYAPGDCEFAGGRECVE